MRTQEHWNAVNERNRRLNDAAALPPLTVHLNTPYVSPSGVSCSPIDVANYGWIVRFTGANFAFDKYVSDADFRAYAPQGPRS